MWEQPVTFQGPSASAISASRIEMLISVGGDHARELALVVDYRQSEKVVLIEILADAVLGFVDSYLDERLGSQILEAAVASSARRT